MGSAIGRLRACPNDDELRWGRVGTTACVAVLAAGVSVAAMPVGDAGRQPKITAVRAKADAHVSNATRGSNFGRFRRLRVDARPLARAYVRFDVGNSDDDVRRVNLLLYTHTRSRLGYQVRLVTRKWNERRITFANAPRVSSRYVTSGPIRAGAWKAVDVTSLVGDIDESVSVALTTVGTLGIEIASRESGLRGPRLVIEREADDDGTPTLPPPPTNPP